jgi:hypothetical protein
MELSMSARWAVPNAFPLLLPALLVNKDILLLLAAPCAWPAHLDAYLAIL